MIRPDSGGQRRERDRFLSTFSKQLSKLSTTFSTRSGGRDGALKAGDGEDEGERVRGWGS
jgi:hypothetical protein